MPKKNRLESINNQKNGIISDLEAINDPLTGLYNRKHLIDVLHQRHYPCALLSIDLDNFRQINDYHSHAFGDEVLKATAKRISESCTQQDMIFHSGRGEFFILKEGQFGPKQLKKEASKLINAFHKPFSINHIVIYITTSIGVLNIPSIETPTDRIMIAVDIALYEAKKHGKNAFSYYNPEMEQHLRDRHLLEDQMREALDKHEIEVHYQPQYCLKNYEITGVEALARWRKNGQIILPNEFIPIAEASLAIIPMGRFILHQACKEIHQINQTRSKPLRLAVNVSGVQLKHSDFVSTVKNTLKQTHFPPQLLDLEITESMIMDDVPFFLAQLNALNELGIQITMDDFGTGYSSLSYLQKFPLKKLKIDKTFLKNTQPDTSNYHILKAIIQLANNIGLNTVAEGIENESQLIQLETLDCYGMQGFYFAKPMTLEALVDLTNTSKPKT